MASNGYPGCQRHCTRDFQFESSLYWHLYCDQWRRRRNSRRTRADAKKPSSAQAIERVELGFTWEDREGENQISTRKQSPMIPSSFTFSLSCDHFLSVLFNSRLLTNKSGVPGADAKREDWLTTAGESVKQDKQRNSLHRNAQRKEVKSEFLPDENFQTLSKQCFIAET